MTYAVVRVRGHVDLRPETRDTMKYLRLHRANHCVLLPENPSVDGMLQRAKDYITWGEVEPIMVGRLLKTRGRQVGDKPVDNAFVKANTPFATIGALAEAIVAGKTTLADVPGLKPVIRLHPPRGGFGGNKRPYSVGGALGYRGKDINALLLRMLGPEES